MWIPKKLLVIAKTYPEFSKSHLETVCTAAIDAETGGLVRIYPLSLRYMKEPPKAFDWIEAEVQKNPRDPRPESFKIRQDRVRIVDSMGTQNGWRDRNAWVLKAANEYRSVEALWGANEDRGTSLGLVRPRVVDRVYAETRTLEDRERWDEKRRAALAQNQLFGDDKVELQDLKYPWVEYRVAFHCDDARCKGHDMGVHDWGMYVLDMKPDRVRGRLQAGRGEGAREAQRASRPQQEGHAATARQHARVPGHLLHRRHLLPATPGAGRLRLPTGGGPRGHRATAQAGPRAPTGGSSPDRLRSRVEPSAHLRRPCGAR